MFNWFNRAGYSFSEYKLPPTVYWVGPTSDGRIGLGIGSGCVSMDKQGVEHLIQMLSVARDSLNTGVDNEQSC